MDKLEAYLDHHRRCGVCKPASPQGDKPAVLCRYGKKPWTDYRRSQRPVAALPPAPSMYSLGGLDESDGEE